MPQEKLNDLAKKHGRNSIITMLLFALGMIGLLAGMFMNNVYVRYAALACIAASIIIAFVLVDTAERRYFDAFEDLYMREEFKKRFHDFDYDRKNGFTRKEVEGMGFLKKHSRFMTYRRFKAKYKGADIDSCHLLFKRRNRSKSTDEITPRYEVQLIRITNMPVSMPDVILRPRGASDNEGVRTRSNRPHKLAMNAGTPEFRKKYELLAMTVDDAAMLDDRLCNALVAYRETMRAASRKCGVFVHFYGTNADIMLGNYDNMLMPPMDPTLTHNRYARFAENAADTVTEFIDMFEE